MATIYLNKKHTNFQVGKTSLQKNVVFETNIIAISFILIIAISLMALAGNSLRLQWRYNQTGQTTIGTLIDCDEVRGSKGGYTTYVDYSYQAQEETYYGNDRVGSGQLCDSYPYNNGAYTVYYLGDDPKESGIGSFLHQNDWLESWMFGSIGIAAIALIFYLLMKNRKERYKHAFLQKHADTIIEATVEKVGKVTGRGGYHYANYSFTSPDMGIISGQIRSNKDYGWPKQIQRHDSLQILYLDSETYCVL